MFEVAKISSLSSIFQDLFNDILYFSVAQTFVEICASRHVSEADSTNYSEQPKIFFFSNIGLLYRSLCR